MEHMSASGDINFRTIIPKAKRKARKKNVENENKDICACAEYMKNTYFLSPHRVKKKMRKR